MILLVGISTLLVLYLGGVYAAEGRFSPGNIVEFILYLNMLIWPVASLGWTTALVQKAAASQKRINEFLHEPVDEDLEKGNPFDFQESIQFKSVGFTYPGSIKPSLSQLELTIPKGSIIGITGKTGSGKSTLAQLLTAQYLPDQGQLLIDGESIENFAKKSFYQSIAYVPQDVFLFSDTLANNIAFGLAEETADSERIEEAARKAGLGREINSLPLGLQTMLGERGVLLSGGQKQRVSIARALIRDAAIYIFDDCLSAVDAATEASIIQSFVNALQGKTAIIISHRLASLQMADQIVLLEDGQIVAQGSYNTLLKENEAFLQLHRLQSTEN
jgi:ATP-binding cassette subfamily B protein